jgi:hypothetical protein
VASLLAVSVRFSRTASTSTVANAIGAATVGGAAGIRATITAALFGFDIHLGFLWFPSRRFEPSALLATDERGDGSERVGLYFAVDDPPALLCFNQARVT